nr:sulfatase-like hydrolase/transferase [Agromyces marinus]
MVLTDDHGSQAIGAYGSVLNATPRIDEIAENGWRFDNCFATNALCSPSRASILTGTYSHVNGVSTLVTPIDANQPTFASQLKAAGYRTAMVGKWHMGEHEGSTPEGFDYWDILIGHDGQGEYWDPLFLSAEGERIVEGYATDRITDLAFDWLDSLEGDEPWCLLIFHKAPIARGSRSRRTSSGSAARSRCPRRSGTTTTRVRRRPGVRSCAWPRT